MNQCIDFCSLVVETKLPSLNDFFYLGLGGPSSGGGVAALGSWGAGAPNTKKNKKGKQAKGK